MLAPFQLVPRDTAVSKSLGAALAATNAEEPRLIRAPARKPPLTDVRRPVQRVPEQVSPIASALSQISVEEDILRWRAEQSEQSANSVLPCEILGSIPSVNSRPKKGEASMKG